VATVVDRPRDVTKRDVEERLRDWERRLRELFARVEKWSIAQWGEGCVTQGSIVPPSEYRMEEAGVRPRKLPTLTVQAGTRSISFVPSCLWIIGANGRVDVRVGVDKLFLWPSVHHVLVDMGGRDGQPSEWQIRNRDPRNVLEPFTRDVLLRIASGRP
jgi:hypothetical protein